MTWIIISMYCHQSSYMLSFLYRFHGGWFPGNRGQVPAHQEQPANPDAQANDQMVKIFLSRFCFCLQILKVFIVLFRICTCSRLHINPPLKHWSPYLILFTASSNPSTLRLCPSNPVQFFKQSTLPIHDWFLCKIITFKIFNFDCLLNFWLYSLKARLPATMLTRNLESRSRQPVWISPGRSSSASSHPSYRSLL